MRVLLVSSYFPPHVGGVELVVQQQAAALAGAGHEVVVATTRSDRTQPRRHRQDGYGVVRLPAWNAAEERTGIPYPLVGPAFSSGLRALVRWSEAVHVHDVLYQPPQLAALLAAREPRPMDLTQHVALVDHGSRLVVGAQRATAAVAGRYVYRRARRILVYNPVVYDHLRGRGVAAERIVLTGNGVDTTVFSPGVPRDPTGLRRAVGAPDGARIVLFVGRLVQKKGYRELIAAAGPEYHLVLVGPGRPPERLPAGATCLGPVARDQLVDLYRLADLFVLPSTGEMATLAMQEALACGLPVVTTDDIRYDRYGIDRELLRLVPAQPLALRQAILTVLGDHELSGRMRAYSRRVALERFDGAAHVRALLDLYDERAPTPTSATGLRAS